MGQEMSDYFNRLLMKYNIACNDFMKSLAMEMWGDRINFKYIIPAGSQAGSQTERSLLKFKDPSGMDCFESK